MTNSVAILAALIGASAVFYADMRRRRLAFGRAAGWNVFTLADLAAIALLCAVAVWTFVSLIPSAASKHVLRLDTPPVWRIAAAIGIFIYVWGEGKRQIQFQRPNGIVCGEEMILVAAYFLVESFAFANSSDATVMNVRIASAIGIVVGAALVGLSVKKNFK